MMTYARLKRGRLVRLKKGIPRPSIVRTRQDLFGEEKRKIRNSHIRSSQHNRRYILLILAPPPSTMNQQNDDPQVYSGSLRAHALRLQPGQDLVSTLEQAAKTAMDESNASSAFVLTAVGSLEYLKLRMASAEKGDGDNQNDIKEWIGQRFEIISLVGTFSKGGKHLHMCVSGANGETYGGHVIAGRIFTTLEIVLGTIDGVNFDRLNDPNTGYKELVVRSDKDTTRRS